MENEPTDVPALDNAPTLEIEPTLREKIDAFVSRRNIFIETCRNIQPKTIDPQLFAEDNPDYGVINSLRQSVTAIGEDLIRLQNPDLAARVSVAQTMLFVDAGFTAPDLLDEVMSDLSLDVEHAEKIEGNTTRDETRKIISNAVERVRALKEGRAADIDLGYGLSDLFENSGPELGPKIDLVQEIQDANVKALAENPDYKKLEDGGVSIVWKYMTDDAKRMWNYQIWNRNFLINPDAVRRWYVIRPERKIDGVPIGKKINIKKPK